MKKSIYLFLALLLPIAVFLFLKFYGKNEFEVKPLFQTAPELVEVCENVQYTLPYTVADSVLEYFKWRNQDSLTLIVFMDSVKENQHEISVQLTRVMTELPESGYRIVSVHPEFYGERATATNQDTTVIHVHEADYLMYKQCAFLLHDPNHALLVDSKKRIRGQYDLGNRDDADRLIVEMKIIGKHY
jgi:hypothetical protein